LTYTFWAAKPTATVKAVSDALVAERGQLFDRTEFDVGSDNRRGGLDELTVGE